MPITAQPNTENKEAQLRSAIVGGNVPQIVLSMISYALELRSSDIHVEPQENTVVIRFRVDGVLRVIIEYPLNMHPAVVSRIKIMSNLKIDEQRVPQDGRTQATTRDGRSMDLRISTFPTLNGEKIVMRIQDKSRKIPSLEELGLEGNSMKFIQKALALPSGIILNTGPTGSGKTTTLYACLEILNTKDVNILTIEDPIEIEMAGLNQSQVHPDIQFTFATGLRSALRQDPDIIMVGEIRDHETMDVSIEASLTGHLVLSTIHTNSAVETLTRISNMDIPAFLMASTIDTIIAQRLVRKLCEKCKAEYTPEPNMMKRVARALDNLHADEKVRFSPQQLQAPKFFKAVGCKDCGGVGYFGRVGIFEVMYMDNRLRRLILGGKTSLEIEKAAMEGGMVNLEQSGLLKAIQGLTTLEEIYRVARESEDESDDNAGAGPKSGVLPQNTPALQNSVAVSNFS